MKRLAAYATSGPWLAPMIVMMLPMIPLCKSMWLYKHCKNGM